jgi:CRP/FNR family transcriptional regulator
LENILIDKNLFKSMPFFSDISDETLEKLSQIATLKNCVASDILFYEKDEKDDIFYLYEGSVKLYKVDRFDSEIFLYKVTSNSMIFNTTKLCDEHTISCYANAEFIENSKVVAFDNAKFKELMHSDHDFMRTILRESFKMIQQLQCIISRDIVFDGTAKVAHMLAHDLNNFNTLKKHEIAYMLHIQPETLSRILKKLTRNGVIEIEKNSVKILNLDELKAIYE